MKPQEKVEDREHLVVVQGQQEVAKEEEDGEIAKQNAVAESKFKSKFGNLKPNAGALLNRQRAHETRYFDSGDAFSNKKDQPLGAGSASRQHLSLFQDQNPGAQ